MNTRRGIPCLLFFFGVSLIAPSSVHSGSVADSLMAKVKSQGKSDAVLELPSILSSVMANPFLFFLSGDAKTSFLTNLMQQFTKAAQAPFMSAIKDLGFAESVQPFWLANKVSIKNANLPLLKALSIIPGLFTLREPQKVNLIRGVFSEFHNISKRADNPEWGVKQIEAPDVWQTKTRGEKVIVAGIDTGVFKDHEALRSNFQPSGWFDAMGGEPEPYDDDGHGTHTMGTIAGQKGIGVAPGATWIACKGLGPQGGSEESLIDCAQFVVKFKPTPGVVCNSWGTSGGNTFFNDEIKGWQAVGIVPVFAIGNEGSGCKSAGSPGDQLNVISVGATDSKDGIARFSSRGFAPGTKDRYKPEISAPGVNIRSAGVGRTDSYATMQGTSMAAPHVTGAVALMLSANPKLKFKDILKKLQDTAVRPSLTKTDAKCGKANGNWPNNVYGYGRISVKKAMA